MLGVVSYAAAQAQVRARLPRLIPPELWPHLVAVASYEELVSRLRETAYAECLDHDLVTVEQSLRLRLARAARTMAQFLPGKARQVVRWYSRRFEVENLKTLIRALHYGLEKERALSILLPVASPGLPWKALLGSGSVPALVEQLAPTPYGRCLAHALPRYTQENRPFYLEVALDLDYFSRLVLLIEELRGRDRREAERLLGYWIATQNLLWAYRYRLYARMLPEEVLNFTLHRAFRVSLETVRRVALGSPVAAEAIRLGIRLPDLAEPEALTRLEWLAARALYQEASKTFARSIFHIGGVLAYLALLESEIADLILLLEGKRSGVPATELDPYLLRGATA